MNSGALQRRTIVALVLISLTFVLYNLVLPAVSLAEDISEKQLKKLEKKIKKKSRDASLRLEAGALLTESREEASEEWIKKAAVHYEKALEVDPGNAEAHWGAGQVWEYAGEYTRAILHYRWLVENALGPRQSEARAHLITCEFLVKSRKTEDPPAGPVEEVEVSDERIKERTGWGFLKELVASVVVTGGIAVAGRDGQHLQAALGLLYDWSDAPSGQEVTARNRFLAGMVSTLATIVAERKLGVKVDAALQGSGRRRVEEWPESRYAGEMEEEYRKAEPEEGRRFEISDDLTIVEQWDVPDLSGEWKCRTYNGFLETKSSLPQLSGRTSVPEGVSRYRFVQNGRHVVLIYKGPYLDAMCASVPHRGVLSGSSIELAQDCSEPVEGASAHSRGRMVLKVESHNRLVGHYESTMTLSNAYGTVTHESTCQIEFTRTN